MTSFSSKLKDLRKAKGFNQEEVARKMGLSIGRYQQFEYGMRPSAQQIEQLNEIFGFDFTALLDSSLPMMQEDEAKYSVKDTYLNIISTQNDTINRLTRQVEKLNDLVSEYITKQ